MKPTADIEENEIAFQGRAVTRRRFLRRSVFGGAAAWTLPAFLNNTLLRLDAGAADNPPSGAGGPILVIMQLSGGNDQLNTLIPYTNSYYVNARPAMALSPAAHSAIAIGGAPALDGASGFDEPVALHPLLGNFGQFWDDGDLAVINGVGYPNPNLSHFTSFDYYHSAKPNEFVTDGWLGRFFDHQCAGCPPQTAMHLSNGPTLALRSVQGNIASVSTSYPSGMGWQHFNERSASLEALYRKAIGIDHPVDSGISAADDALAYVQRSAHAALLSSVDVTRAIGAANSSGSFPHVAFPNSNLGNNFRDVAAMIEGRLDTCIYYVEQGGYDTHGGQISGNDPVAGTHAYLLYQLNAALGAFVAEMKAQGNWDRVLILTFSEFGRKVIQNGSLGTDHGAAQTLFAMGGQVNPGFYGKLPDLAPAARIKNDSLVHNVDFRQVYRTVLEKWMGVPASAMGAIFPSQPSNFSTLDFV